ncbi:hypothetical protein MP228_003250 [Amoeboaphelidium protococcarum]|nr:hypothetical protein MP228_003250 [Amoeboaphelidium protococcarum]
MQAKFGSDAGKEKKTQKKQYKWKTSLDSSFKFDFKNQHPLRSLLDFSRVRAVDGNDQTVEGEQQSDQELPLNGDSSPSSSATKAVFVEGVERSATGSVGVFFVQLNCGSFVLKPGAHSLYDEVTASLISLLFQVPTPRFVLLRTADESTDHLITCIAKQDKNMVTMRLSEYLYVLAMEYVPGCGVQELKNLSIKNYDEMITSLGKILALDVMLNNGDRIPFIWENQGNPGNMHTVIRANESNLDGNENNFNLVVDLINIDPGIRALDIEQFPQEGDEYINKVADVLKKMVQFDQNVTSAVPKEVVYLLKILSMWAQQEFNSSYYAKLLTKGFTSIIYQFRDEARAKEIYDTTAIILGIDIPLCEGYNQPQKDFILKLMHLFESHSKL